MSTISHPVADIKYSCASFSTVFILNKKPLIENYIMCQSLNWHITRTDRTLVPYNGYLHLVRVVIIRAN